MKFFAIVAIAVLALTGCTPSVQSAFDKACSGLTGAYAVFSEVREVARPNTQMLVDAAFKSVNPLCVNPPKDQTEAAVRIAAASLVIWKAYRSTQ